MLISAPAAVFAEEAEETEFLSEVELVEEESSADSDEIEISEEDEASESSEEQTEEANPVPEENYEEEQGEEYEAALKILSENSAVKLFGDDAAVTLEGAGTAENPYKIYTEQEFINFAVGNIEGGLSAYWSLENDIELTADTWAPIGAYTPFSGVFYGNGHKITSTKLFQSTAMSGIFGQNAGTIKDLDVNVTIVDVATNTGSLCATNTGRIENCHAEGSITTNENKNIGGLVGYNNGGTIYNCGANVVITAPNSTVGGLVGYSLNGKIQYCRNTNDDDESVITGNIVGGLVGYVENNNNDVRSLVSNCYSLSKIAGGSRTGGLIGYADVYNSGRGYIQIEYCYAKGVITKGSSTGGLIGGINSNDRIPVRYCYYNTINSENKIGFGMGLSAFKKQESFYDWNFNTVWAIDPDINNGYPYINLTAEEIVEIEGEGTKEKPYIVTNEKQLCYIASEKLPLNAYYKQANDIVITANYWTPVGGDGTTGFAGVYDGGGFSVTGANLENVYYKYQGLFGQNSGTIKNLTAEGWYSGNNYVGVLVGRNTGTIDNCSSYIDDDEKSLYGTECVGGLVGDNTEGTITNSHSSADVNITDTYAGGLVGYMRNGIVKYCYAVGDVTGRRAGGLLGYVKNDNSDYTSTVSNCYATGRIYGGGNDGGGLVGYAEIYNNGRGYIYIEYCYARGIVSGTGSLGGLVGNISTRDRVRVRCCYYNITNTGNNIGFGVKVADLKKQNTFYNWDFDNVWKIDKTNSGLPHLDVTGERENTVLKGNGEEDRPYLIYTEQDLLALVDDSHGNYDLSYKHFYRLENDIELTANFWTPIGANATNAFRGIFDGNGHKITNLRLSNTHYEDVGLFGNVTGTVKNLTVEGVLVGRERTGIITAHCSGTLENCSVSGTVSSSNTDAYAGGIVGWFQSSTELTLCSSSADVSAPNGYAGGVVGKLDTADMTYCCATGNVSGSSAGGAVGWIQNGDSLKSTNVRNCYARGDVSATTDAGGFAGFAEVYNNNRGYTNIEYCYATGNVKYGSQKGAGLVGKFEQTSGRCRILYSYYNSDNDYPSKQGFSATLGQMKEKELYYMWNFDNIWAIDKDVNDGYPYLNVNGKIKKHTLEGYGDEDDPYLIENEEDLWLLVDGTYDLSLNSCYQLQDNIEITAEHWTPIGGNGRTVFNGIFDGNGYTISGIKLYNVYYANQGLFGENTGTIKNLNVVANISGEERVGAICGYNRGTIENCGSVGTVTAATYAGGIVGQQLNTAKISGCYSGVSVSGKYAGGIIGELKNDNSSTQSVISNCYALGNVYGSEQAGGLAGRTETSSSRGTTHIEYSYSTGKVKGNTKGGLVGYSNDSVRNEIVSSYYNTTITELADIDRGTPLEDSAMKLQSSYVGYDFNNIWQIDANENNGYPTLQAIEEILPLSVEITELSVDATAEVSVGGSVYVTPVITPEDATNTILLWSSSNNAVATVSNGKIVGMSVGTANITVTTADGQFEAVCVVTVNSAPTVAVTGVTLDKSSADMTVDDTLQLVATVSPTNATDKSVTWKSSDTSVATVANGKITAKAAGTATITVTTVDGGYKAECTVKVSEKAPATVAVTGVTLDTSDVSLEEGKTEILVATVLPANATDKTVSWKSSDEKVATVLNGKITAKSAGTATITVTTADGGYTAECEVTVTEKFVDENAPTITIGEVKAKPGNTVDVTVVLKNNTGFMNLGVEVGYNADVMTLTKVTADSGVGLNYVPGQSLTQNPYNFGWSGVSDTSYNGTLATLTFTVKDDAADGVYPITLDYFKGRNGDYVDGDNVNFDEDYNAVGFVYVGGSVTVASYVPGDINGDGVVDNKDGTHLLRYLAGWDLTNVNNDALDVDGSSKVDDKDGTHLLRYLAGWNVTLH